ncbi:helix-turn-helix transcriptional regulator [Microbacterium hydrocarbonoxydans]|uniref:HTH domain-containing protein n=1 Tax=Microbacterium hydrocarbonoxydans TaxID=273678 RepID=A0A1H4T4L7_9MICO|nr:HTH domain-containing protein [Microbacterium hydrocarbonoxydans]
MAPIILGSGRSLFGELDEDVLLTVRGSHATDDGLVRTTYDVVAAEARTVPCERREDGGVNRTDRLYALVEELRAMSPRPRSARWLAERFEVSRRTVERDLSALQQAGLPIWAEPGRTVATSSMPPRRWVLRGSHSMKRSRC